MRCARVVVVTSLIAGCGSVVVPEPRDGGDADAGVTDAGQRDGGVERDAGPEWDGGVEYTLTATVVGVGEGSIQFVGSVRACPSDCEVSGPSGTVDLRADALAPDEFRGWSGACSGLEPTCRVTLTRNATVGAEFSTPGGFRRFRTITAVPLPEGSRTAELLDLNDDGVFVGRADLPFPALETFAVRGDRGGVIESLESISTLPGSRALGINDAGWTVGAAVNAQGDGRAVIWAPRPKAFAIELGTLGGAQSDGFSIARDNRVVGWADTATSGMHGFLRTPDGTLRDLGTLGGINSIASGIAGDWIVGRAQRADGEWRGFRARAPDFELEQLGTLGGDWSSAFRVNRAGAILGYSGLPDGRSHAVYVAPPPAVELVDIGTLGGADSVPYLMNDSHIAVGTAQVLGGDWRAFIWSPLAGRIVDLNDLLPRGETAWELTTAAGINNRGQVVGTGRRAGVEAIFFLDP